MILYQKATLEGAPVGMPGPLPAELVGLDNASLVDLDWVDAAQGYGGLGFLPVEFADPKPTPHFLPKVDFWRLFTDDEETAFNRARRRVASLTDLDYDDPVKARLVAFERFLNRFDATSVVDVDHPETQAAIDLMVSLEILTAERATQAKLGVCP